jgi:site-specific recombinase XerD
MKGETQLEGFCDYLVKIRAKSPATANSYSSDVAGFLSYCRKLGRAVDTAMNPTQVGLYVMERTEDRKRIPEEDPKLSSRSAARTVSALIAYAQYLVYEGRLSKNPLAGMQGPKYQRALPPYFNVDEIKRVITAYDSENSPAALRNAAILYLLYAAGLRVSECASLSLKSIQTEERMLRVTGKGNKQRIVAFGKPAAAALARYLEHGRPALTMPGSGDALWLNRSGTALSDRSMRKILDQAAARAGCIKPISPHKLRHACATHMLEGGADIRLLQEFLGHENLNTTQVYTQVTRTKLLQAYEQTHPRATGESDRG